MALRNRTIATIAIIVSLIVIVAGYIVSEMNSYQTIQTIDGVSYVQTKDAGLVKVKSDSYDMTLAGNAIVEYGKYSAVTVKVTVKPINPVTPSKLPNTSAPHGVNTCTMIDSNSGATFTVTTDQDCATLN